MGAGQEHAEQVLVMKWANGNAIRYPELDLLFHIPNGGHRHKAVAVQLQLAGVKRGVPDWFLPVARNDWHGLFIELKYGQNKPTEHQEAWLVRLTEQGYLAVVCWGWFEAVEVIKDYLGIVEDVMPIELADVIKAHKPRRKAA